jgi:hypothetical protein
MFAKLSAHFIRILSALAIAGGMAVSLPHPTMAAAVPTITILSVKAGESVTIKATNLPSNREFTARMDVMGDYALGGTVVGANNSGSGSFTATYTIPSDLKDETRLAIRIDTPSGWFSYNWFDNQTTGVTPTPTPSTGGGKPFLTILGVEKDESVTVQASRFPANQTFTIRVGPFYSFFKNYVVVGSIKSSSSGSFTFSVALPENVKGVELVTIRLDSGSGAYAFNAFTNVSGGSVDPIDTPSTPGKCEIVSMSPGSVTRNADFDAVWTVKNVSGKTWDMHSVDYKFVSGTAMHDVKVYDFKQTVKSGETVKLVVDMTAPSTKGTYTTNWAVVASGTTLCNLPLTVVVK